MKYASSSGLLDYGARLYDPALARWISVDPLAESSVSMSPFVYCYNNPINLIDPDGKEPKWGDANGDVIWSNGQWTPNAPRDVMRVGDAMRATPTGLMAFNLIANNPLVIPFVISPESKIVIDDKTQEVSFVRGEFENVTRLLADGSVRLISGTITIYEGSLLLEINGLVLGLSGELTELIQSLGGGAFELEVALAAVAVHEAMHTTNENVQKIAKNESDVEQKPEEIQLKYLKEMIVKMNAK